MSLLTAISHSLTGLRAIQADIQVISSNVTNAQREDYTRKSVVLSSNVTTASGTGGVSVVGYERATDDSLNNLLRLATSDDGLYNSQKTYLDRVQSLLGSTQDNPVLSKAINDLTSAWRNLSATPESTTLKQNVIFKAQNLASEVRRLADGLDKIETDVKNDVTSAVDTLNTSLARIKQLNDEIVSAQSTGQSAVDLMDLRDVEVNRIAALTKINTFPRDGGRIALYTPGGLMLLDATASEFTWDGVNVALDPSGTVMNDVLKGGRIEGLLGLLDQGTTAANLANPGKSTIYKIETQLNKIVDLFTNSAGTFATAYNSATTASGELASSFFTGSTRYNFYVNSALTNGTSTLKQASASGVASDMELENRSISAGGLSVTNASYTSFADSIIAAHSQNVSQVSSQAKIYDTQKGDYKKRLQDAVGVNVDTELVRLTQLQNAYSANARVISTIQQMFEILDNMV